MIRISGLALVPEHLACGLFCDPHPQLRISQSQHLAMRAVTEIETLRLVASSEPNRVSANRNGDGFECLRFFDSSCLAADCKRYILLKWHVRNDAKKTLDAADLERCGKLCAHT